MFATINDFYTMAQFHNQLTFKNNVLCNITRAIQAVQQFYIQKESALTNSDCQAHELCQQFDGIFIYGLKRIHDSYFKVAIEFTHKDVIMEINSLLNVTTSFGKARAWLYHALNDNLMESYLKCFLENRKILLQYYKKDSFAIDEQIINVLITLVSGLENVQFKLNSDVPYLDHSCWPTHLYSKRDLIQQKLQILNQHDTKVESNNSTAAATSTTASNDTNHTKAHRKRKGTKKVYVNNVSLDSNSSTNFSDLYTNDIANDSETSIDHMNRLKLNGTSNYLIKNRNKSDLESNFNESIDNTQYTSLATSLGTNNKPRTKASSTSSVTSSEDIISTSVTSSSFRAAQRDLNKSIEIDNEITKLREVAAANAAAASAKTPSPTKPPLGSIPIRKLSYSSIQINQELENISPSKFDKKIQDLENYSTIIENAASKMDECVKSMTEVYQSYDGNRAYFESPMHDDTTPNDSLRTPSTSVTNDNEQEKSMYDDFKLDEKIHFTDNSLNQNESHCDTLTSFDEKLKLDLKQEIKIDNNTKLMLIMNVFQNDQNEELIKMYHVTRGHSQGEIEEVFLLLTSYSIYVLLRNHDGLFKKEAIINHNEIDYIEISMNGQAFHIVCVNRRKNYWFTTASRTLTDAILTYLQISRERSNLKLPLLSIDKDATTQKIAIKKFIANNENVTPQDFEIKNYALVFWEDQASATTQLIQKEGFLMYLTKSNATHTFTSSNQHEWKRAYFVLKNDVLSQFRDQNEKRAQHIIKLNGEDFSGCRKSSNSNRPFTMELILSNSTTLYLAAKSEAEASEWLIAFCKTISLGNSNTDVPINSCLPCCSVITNQKLYYCHEDLNSNFYRLLDAIKLQEIIKISYDQTCRYFCIIYVESEHKKKQKYWFVYFVDEIERNSFINQLKNTWEALFQIPFTVEILHNNELLRRCENGLETINNTWLNYSIRTD